MGRSVRLLALAATASVFFVAACGPRLQSHPPAVAPTRLVPPPMAPVKLPVVVPIQDPIDLLIRTSQEHFAEGQRELELGHLERAKAEFNAALQVLLESPYGARSEPRLREHFDRLVDRISTYEINALSVGDGFAEKKYEAATIDELLATTTFDQPAASREVQQAVASDLESTEHDVPIPLNARVLAYVQAFQGRLREWIEVGLKRGSRYLPMIQNVFRAEGLPLDLAYVPLIESAFNPAALSRAKAKGVWQFMAGTALAHGLKRDWYVDERADPEKATLAAAKYLRSLKDAFQGDWHLALASYNGGPGLVQRAIARTGLRDFWKLSARPRLLPRETREYVPMILAAIVIARNPAQYGISVVGDEPMAYEKVKMPGPVDLRRVAEWAGTSVEEIQKLNPELRRWTTPVKDPAYELKVPPGSAPLVEARLDELDPMELRGLLNWYTVKPGDNIVSIARKLNVNRTDLLEANYLSARARVMPGQQLVVPRASATVLAARTDRPVPPVVVRPVVATAGQVLAEGPSIRPSDEARLIYQVKSGDTLFSIARLFRTTVQAVKVWNQLKTNSISAGDRLTIFTKRNRS
jgi:membrane-bound lytic murein transglycosylase D